MGSPFNIMSLCSGVGMLDLGIRLAVPAARTVCMVEREAFCVAQLVTKMEEGFLDPCPVWTDLVRFDGTPFRGVVDCIAAGYPCQPFSAAGKRLGADDERHLWAHIARIVGQVQPAVVFLENVPGHLGIGFEEVGESLQSMGYVFEAGVFSALEIGATHRRERLFVLAHAESSIVGDGDRARLERRGLQKRQRRNERIARETGRTMLFPPAPADHYRWSLVHHAIEPAVCGMADGSALRVDRLRALGNGCVPSVVAYAFLTLAEALAG